MIIADCPGCQMGNHDDHVHHWGKRPPGVIDGEFCYCKGECVGRKSPFDFMLDEALKRTPLTALSPDAQAEHARLTDPDREREALARDLHRQRFPTHADCNPNSVELGNARRVLSSDWLRDHDAELIAKAKAEVVSGVRAWCAINEIAEPPLDWVGLGEFLARVDQVTP